MIEHFSARHFDNLSAFAMKWSKSRSSSASVPCGASSVFFIVNEALKIEFRKNTYKTTYLHLHVSANLEAVVFHELGMIRDIEMLNGLIAVSRHICTTLICNV